MPYRTEWLLTAALMTMGGCAGDPAARAQKYVGSGDKYVRAGKFPEAAIEYRKAIQLIPTLTEAHEKLADAAVRAQDPRTAVGAVLRVAELKPDDPGAQIRAASVYLLAGEYEEARDRATAVLDTGDADINAHLVLAQALAQLHDPAGSEQALQEAVRVAPGAPEPHIALGSLHWRAGRTQAADAAFRRAIALDAQHLQANQALAMFFMATDHAAEAEPLWRRISGHPRGSPFALADYFIATNRLVQAEHALGDLVSKDDTRGGARLRLAAVQYGRNQRALAHATLRDILQETPGQVPALLLQARFFQAERRLEESLRAAQTAVAADRANAEAVFIEGEIHAARGDDDEAIGAFETALRLDPGDAAPHLAIARVRIRQGQALEAVKAAERARAARPDHLAPMLVLIETLAHAGQRAQAIDRARAAIAQWPQVSALHVELGALHAAEGQPEDARRALSDALALDPVSIPALAALAELDIRAGRGQAALARIDERLRRQPDHPALVLLTARTQAAIGQHDAAETTLRELVQQNPSNLDAYVTLGRLYLARGRLDEARAEFEQLAARDQNGGAHTVIGMILLAQNRSDKAQQAFERAVAINPHAGVAANNLAWLYQEHGRLEEALKWAVVADRELRGIPETKNTLGWIHAQRGAYQDALPALAASVWARPDNPVYRYHLGYAYWKTGSIPAAREELRRAVGSTISFAARDEAERILNALETEEAR